MSPQEPLLFDIGAPRPTTRDIAEHVRRGGVAALPDAVLRGDAVRYQEVACRSALNAVEGMPFKWTLNPYRGCTHGCHYCFARRYHVQFELDSGDDFASVILIKKNFVQVLSRELDKSTWRRELVALGTATDPYQPIEGHYKLTRGTLVALASSRTPVGLVTKGPMVVRDRDILCDLGRRARCTVSISVPTVDEDAWRALEPGTAHPLQRLRAVKALVDAGVNAGVLMAPVVPGLTSQISKLEQTMKAIADHGAQFVGANLLHLKDGTRDHFMAFLAREFPHLVAGYDRLYVTAYARKPYVAQVRAIVRSLREKYPLRARWEDTPSADEQGVESQSAWQASLW